MSSVFTAQTLRFVMIILFQGLILRRINLGWEEFNYISIMLYPVLIMLLPMKMPRVTLLLVSFVLGLVMDLFYDSLGVHASACVFTAFMRPFVLQFLEPRGGYPVNANPTLRDFDASWFMQYSGALLFLHLLFYFSVEVFSFDFLGEILLKTVVSFILSFLSILLFVFLFNPKR